MLGISFADRLGVALSAFVIDPPPRRFQRAQSKSQELTGRFPTRFVNMRSCFPILYGNSDTSSGLSNRLS